MLDIHLLRIFVSVYKYKSITKAAEDLLLSQPTVSEHIKTLEKLLECILFDRINKKIFPSIYAEKLYEKALVIIDLVDSLKNNICSTEDDFSGTITLGTSSIPAAYVLPKVITNIKKAYKHLNFNILSKDSQLIIENVLNHNIALGLVGTKILDNNLDFIPFTKDSLVLIAAPTMIKKNRLTLNDIKHLPIIFRQEGSGTLKELLNAFEQRGLTKDELNIAATFSSNEAVKEAVINGIGISFVSSLSIVKETKCKILKTVDIDNLKIERFFYIVKHKKRTLSPVYEYLIKTLIKSNLDY